MKKVIIESPYAGDVERNVEYAKRCLKDSLMLGEAPICSHLLHTQVLDDTIQDEREIGIKAGHEWLSSANKVAFYIDYGISNGMMDALNEIENINSKYRYPFHVPIKIEYRKIGENEKQHQNPIEDQDEIIIQTESGKIVSDKDWDSYLGISHLFAEKYGIFLNAHENIKFLRK